MSRPLRINSTSPISIREMSDSDIEYITYRVLVEFANTQSGPGTLNINGTGTSIGSFVDTSRPYQVGEHPVGTETDTNEITVYQNRRETTIDLSARPVIFTGSSLEEISNSQLNDKVIFDAGVALSNGGIGSYYLGTSAPSGGTWANILTFEDTTASDDISYTLYRKVNDWNPPVVRPLKTVSGSLREMTDNEINALVDNLREYIRTTGIGHYSLEKTAPSSGTYINVSDTVDDTRHILQDVSYTGTADYTGFSNFTGFGTFSRFFSGREVTYTGTRSYSGSRTFTGDASYTGTTVMEETETISTRALWLRQS